MKIAIITFYFGELPNYFDVWLKSVEGNPEFDFIFYTDNQKKYDYPSNMQVNYCSFDQIKAKVQNCFDFTIALDKPYKFTDYKPAFGIIFKEELRDYDFWGYVDQDVVLGELSKFITTEILGNYERILTRDHLSLYKNTEEIAERFMANSSRHGFLYKKVFQSYEIFCFGEMGPYGTYHMWIENNWKIYNEKITADISFRKHYFHLTDTEGFEETQSPKQMFLLTIQNGKSSLYQYCAKNRQVYEKEFLYMHLQKRKMQVERVLNEGKKVEQDTLCYVIVPNRIIQIETVPSKEQRMQLIETYVGRINPLNEYLRFYRRLKLKLTKYLKQLRY